MRIRTQNAILLLWYCLICKFELKQGEKGMEGGENNQV